MVRHKTLRSTERRHSVREERYVEENLRERRRRKMKKERKRERGGG